MFRLSTTQIHNIIVVILINTWIPNKDDQWGWNVFSSAYTTYAAADGGFFHTHQENLLEFMNKFQHKTGKKASIDIF